LLEAISFHISDNLYFCVAVGRNFLKPKFLKTHEKQLTGRFLWNLHNRVNISLGKNKYRVVIFAQITEDIRKNTNPEL